MDNNLSSSVISTTFSIGLTSLIMTQVAPVQALSLSFTGVELFTNPDVSFPTTQPSVSGNSLDFGTGGVAGGVLLELPLLPALSRGDLTFSIDFNYTPLTSDNDPIIGISDGDNIFGLLRSNNSGGSFGIISGSGTLGGSLMFPLLTDINPVDSFSFDLTITSDPLGNNFISNYVEGSDSATGPFNLPSHPFNIENELSLVFIRGTPSLGGGIGVFERYRINSLSVTVEDNPISVPESNRIIPLSILGLIGVFRKIFHIK